jgi:hypothetical protein
MRALDPAARLSYSSVTTILLIVWVMFTCSVLWSGG